MNTIFDVASFAKHNAAELSKYTGKSPAASEKGLKLYLQSLLKTMAAGEEKEIYAQRSDGRVGMVVLTKISDGRFTIRSRHSIPLKPVKRPVFVRCYRQRPSAKTSEQVARS